MLQESLTQAIEEVRLVAYHMRPVGHSTDKPAEMIRELALYFEDRYPLRFELLLRSDLSVDWEQEDLVHLYRIAQEALTNVVRHAEASRVSVELQYTSEGLVYLRVADNGKGLGKANEEGLGRHGMRERAELLGGTIRWKSEEGRGTEVELIVSPEGAQERGVRVEDFSR
jgi:signal transduction histidine kinase